MFDLPDGAPSTIEIWRLWTELEEAERSIPPIHDGRPGAPDYADQECQSALCAEIQVLRELMQRRPIQTFEDVAVALDMILEYQEGKNEHPDDRLILQRLIDALERLAPSVKIGAIERRERWRAR